MITISLIAQETVTLNFTATNQNGSYHSFDVVNVTNVTRGWTESLMYPDTTLVLTSYDGLQENFNNDCLSEVYPNPLSGTAYVTFWMQKTGVINVRVININGRVLSDVTDIIDEGPYQLIINISEPQTAILVIQTSDNQYVKKILNVGYGTCDNISINKVTNTLRGARLRDVGEFKIGDIMSYIAVAFEGSAMIESNRITHAQYDDENIVLTFQATNPSVSTTDVTDITDNTAISGGIVASNGGGTVSARGVCWSTSPNPTLSDSHTADGGGTGSYASNITGLTEYTTYYVRAYATNEVGTEYGEQKTFTTEHTIVVPVVTTNDVTDITSNSAVSGGNVTSSGYGTVSARGICWSASQNPTINDSHTMDGNGIGNFTSTMAGLNEYTTYYVRAYATNEAGTVYGEQKTFTTEHAVVLPTVTTNDVTNITQTTALSGGNVTSSGYGTVSARGVCWSTAHNPTVSGNHTTDGTGTGTFTSNITELTGNTTYYVQP